jgi:23S rRNA pseudouridine955/2504/2580 synthase
LKPVDFTDLILFEDEDYIVINKPPHFPTLEDRHEAVSIKELAKQYHSDAQMGHRLDKETSGALVIAKNPEAYRHISMQFEDREVLKKYHAVVDGIQDFEDVNVYLPIETLKNGTVKIDKVNGKIAETFFNTLEAYRNHTLVECIPVTGRMHQIRIHLSCLKAPIVCDETYGGKMIFLSDLKKKFNLKKDTEEQPLMKRVALHAFSIGFHLMNGDKKLIEAPYPKDFAVLVKQLQKFK